jgi:glycerol-3-phosphate dehydrogenase (NAD(P)+)
MNKQEEIMEKISVIGAGSWGTALATVLERNGHEVTIWSIMEDEITSLKENHEHLAKLPGVAISEKIKLTTNLEEAVTGKDLLVFAVPSMFTRSTAHAMAQWIKDGQIIVNVAKGIEDETLMTLTEILEQEIPNAVVCALSGPSHAEEVGKQIPTTVVAGAKKQQTAEYLQNVFMNDEFRVYTSPDLLGMEIGAALKNVIALAAGMADGLGYGDNTKAALITRGIAEIGRLGLKMGANIETIQGLTGIGDLIVTCASMHSRNRRAGILIGQGKTMQEAMDEVQMIVEGVYSTKAAVKLAAKYQVPMPIVEQVNQVLFEGKPAKEAVIELMQRDKRIEHSDLSFSE